MDLASQILITLIKGFHCYLVRSPQHILASVLRNLLLVCGVEVFVTEGRATGVAERCVFGEQNLEKASVGEVVLRHRHRFVDAEVDGLILLQTAD